MFLAGVLPVSSVALHSLDLISIRVMLFPNLILFTLLLFKISQANAFSKILRNGLLAGLIGVCFYDLSRIPFIILGWGDFIPSLGGWITNSEENFFVGYLWRYLGNAIGLGICFSLLNSIFAFKKVILAGTLFGISVFLGLDLVLTFSETAQEMMFKITPLTFIGSLTGHIVFGTCLGLFFKNRNI